MEPIFRFSNKLLISVPVTIGLFILLLSFSIKQPKMLIIGDSISIGYTPFVQQHCAGKAEVVHNPGNAQHTGKGLKNIADWIGDGQWDIIQFNWGLWDLCYRNLQSKNEAGRDKVNGKITVSVEEYAANLDSIVCIIKKHSSAKLIFVTTTYVPTNESGRFSEDVARYNKAALAIMKKHGVVVNDLCAKSVAIHKKAGSGDDNVHYSKEGYKLLGDVVNKFLDKVLLRIN